MKKLMSVIVLLTSVSILSAQIAQTNPPPSFWGGIGQSLQSLGISTSPTNYAAAPFVGFSTSGDKLSAGLLLVENINANVGIVAGFDHLWFGGKPGSANLVSGGVTLKQPTHPLQWLTSNTNTWAYKATVTPYALAMVGSSFGNTSTSGGGMCGIARAGFNLDLINISGWELGAGGDYGNRTGAGEYNGNWIDFTINIRKGF